MIPLVPLPCFLFSRTPQTFLLPSNKFHHPFCKFFEHLSSLKVREAFLWPEGHIVWICKICYENLGGGTEWIHADWHQSTLEQHIVLPLAPVQLPGTVCTHFSLVITTYLLKFINNNTWCLQGFSGINLSLKRLSNYSDICMVLNSVWCIRQNLLGVHLRVGGGRGRGHSCVNSSNCIHQQSEFCRQSQCVSC